MRLPALAALLLLAAPAAQAQSAKPPGMPAAEAAARRFPQPVRVASLIGRAVLQPVERQTVLGRVDNVVRGADGTISLVVDYGGLLGFGRRPIAVPADAMALLGADVEVLDLTPAQLDALPTFTPANATPLPPDSTIRVALTRPSH